MYRVSVHFLWAGTKAVWAGKSSNYDTRFLRVKGFAGERRGNGDQEYVVVYWCGNLLCKSRSLCLNACEETFLGGCRGPETEGICLLG